jgi:hypothetical protein
MTAFLRALENARKLNSQSVELAARLRVTQESLNELMESARAAVKG